MPAPKIVCISCGLETHLGKPVCEECIKFFAEEMNRPICVFCVARIKRNVQGMHVNVQGGYVGMCASTESLPLENDHGKV